MSMTSAPPLDLDTLRQALRTTDAAALLVPPRILRRVIKKDRHPRRLGLQVPHHVSHVLTAPTLLEIADRDELGVEPDATLPPWVLLLEAPSANELACEPRERVLLTCWRRLFHAQVHRRLEEQRAAGALTVPEMRRRLYQIGPAECAEIRRVLRQDHLLLPPAGPAMEYIEFAAVYLELHYFAPHLLHACFPALEGRKDVLTLLTQDVDADALYRQSRLPGAADQHTTDADAVEASKRATLSADGHAGGLPVSTHGSLLPEADEIARRGNMVQAAILKTRAARAASGDDAAALAHDAQCDLACLVRRLQAALRLDDAEARQWYAALQPLLPRASDGAWPREARVLYDLQKVCVDHERGLYRVNLLGWACTLGRRLLKQPLPRYSEVVPLRHLRQSARHLRHTGLSEEPRAPLTELLDQAIQREEDRVRDSFHPLLHEALEQVELTPQNLPERVARDKLVEELLDRVVQRGFFTLGDVRDAISRNQLKLNDLAGPGEFFLGDKLLKLDRCLAGSLAGVYRRGEVYLRGLQRFSALAFGTRVGRFLTRYLALPFGGAFVALSGLTHLVEIAHIHVELANLWSVGLLGVFFLLLLHVPPFRRGVGKALKQTGRALHFSLIDLPSRLVRLPAVQAFLSCKPIVLLRRHALKPMLLAGGVALLCLVVGMAAAATWAASGAVLLAGLVFFNSRLGRDVEEHVTDWQVRFWRRLLFDFFPGAFRLVLEVFRFLLEQLDRLLYRVDEWFRFRSGDSQASLVLKGVFAPFWRMIAYVVRFCVNLLIEPQVNPIKHFPVVTVAHKLLLPLIPSLASALALTMDSAQAWATATVIIFSIPGVFGFLVWELKENWKLYQANRSATLRAVIVGEHGETVLRLMKPGFHSGTLPKLYRALRRAESRGDVQAAHRPHEGLHHVEHEVRRLVERELLQLLHLSPAWTTPRLNLGHVYLASCCLEIELLCEELGGPPLRLRLEEQASWLLASMPEPGWSLRLEEGRRKVLRTALAGLYKLTGVDAVREHLQPPLASAGLAFAFAPAELVVWPRKTFETAALYSLEPDLGPRWPTRNEAVAQDFPLLDTDELLFSGRPLTWGAWVHAWEKDPAALRLDGEFFPPAPSAATREAISSPATF